MTNTNPLLASLQNIPGETFRLPSYGLFYKNGELDENVKNGEVHVYPMKTVDELIMKSPDKILTGKAIDEVFARCIPDIKKPDQILANDVEYLMAALRVVSYGEMAEISTKHSCKDAKEHSYTINIRDILREARSVDPTSLNTRYTLNLDGYTLTIRPPLYKSVVALYQSFSDEFLQNSSESDIATKLVQNLAEMVESVNGHTDAANIVEWLAAIKAGWVNKIAEFTRASSNWGIEYVRAVKCKDCGEMMQISVPTNPITFFT